MDSRALRPKSKQWDLSARLGVLSSSACGLCVRLGNTHNSWMCRCIIQHTYMTCVTNECVIHIIHECVDAYSTHTWHVLRTNDMCHERMCWIRQYTYTAHIHDMCHERMCRRNSACGLCVRLARLCVFMSTHSFVTHVMYVFVTHVMYVCSPMCIL